MSEVQVYLDGNKKVNAMIDGFTVFTDQPVQAGGENSAPTPFSLFLASIGACAGVYIKSFCDQRGIKTDSITIDMETVFNPAVKMIGKIVMKINVPADFPAQYEEAVARAASLCAVKRHLHPSIENDITVFRRS